MKTYVIEREIEGAGNLTLDELRNISQHSCSILRDLTGVEWVQSYVTQNKVYCVYKAEDPQRIYEHGEKGGFPVNSVAEVLTVISPATASVA